MIYLFVLENNRDFDNLDILNNKKPNRKDEHDRKLKFEKSIKQSFYNPEINTIKEKKYI